MDLSRKLLLQAIAQNATISAARLERLVNGLCGCSISKLGLVSIDLFLAR